MHVHQAGGWRAAASQRRERELLPAVIALLQGKASSRSNTIYLCMDAES